MAAHTIQSLLSRNTYVDPGDIEDVILGCANQAGEDNRNIARMAVLLSGLPVEIGGTTVNRLCASGLQAIMDGSRAIALGDGRVFVCGGVESMSRAPFVIPKAAEAFSRTAEIYDTTLGWRFINPALARLYYPYSMGETAEIIAEKWMINREDQDNFAYQSQQKYQKAALENRFHAEIIPISISDKKGDKTIIDKDEHPRLTPTDKLAMLQPVFKKGGTVTAGNSSGINDGAAALLLASGEYVRSHQLQPLARIVSMAIAGVNPDIMGIGPVPATLKALKRAGLKTTDLGMVELNEAFASQSLACIRDLDLNPEIININGGAIAIGHPLGASGARICGHLAHEIARKKIRYGLATMCIGVGQGAAIIIESL